MTTAAVVRSTALFGLFALAACPKTPPVAAGESAFVYPSAPRGTVTDDYHGTVVADPYRWLENPDAPETRTWIEAENALFEGWVSQAMERAPLRARLEELWNYERFSSPMKVKDRYFYFRNDGLQNQSAMYVSEGIDGSPRVLLDPNALSADGTLSLTEYSVSDDARYLAYGVSDGGSDWMKFRIRDITTGNDLEETLEWVKFSNATWTPDGTGFYYGRYPAPANPLEEVNVDQKLYFHKVGTPQSADTLVYERPDHPDWGFEPHITEDGKTLVLSIWEGTAEKNRIYLQDLTKSGAAFVPLLDGFDAYYKFLGNEGTTFYFNTDIGAPRGKVIAIDLQKPAPDQWKTVIAEGSEPIESASLVGGQFILKQLKDAKSQVRFYDLSGKFVRELALPDLGTATGFQGKSTDNETFFTFESYTRPPATYRLDVSTGTASVFKASKLTFNPDDYTTEQVFYTSKDGTQVPMFLSYKKGLQKTGDTPTLLYGYGGFNIAITPGFKESNLLWMENGGIFAVANLRGGGEYGREWHEAGTLDRKQNVFDDFIGAAEWLIANGYTQSQRLAISGRSNGGLLVGAAITQRPDLFGAALPAVGVQDMLRYHQFTIGWAWASDYGRSDDPKMFPALHAYSPYHNVKHGTAYPPTLITTGDHDDRVVPAHSFKFAAALQHAQTGPNPIFIRIDTRAGHGAGKPTAMLIDETADIHAFLIRALKIRLGKR